jgi:FkbM family methyltransferase
MSFAARTLRRAGATPVGLPLVYLAGRLARAGLMPFHAGLRALEELAAAGPRQTVVATLDLGGAHKRALEFDLSISGCRHLLAEPPRDLHARIGLPLFLELIRDATTIIDVGANTGIFTYAAACHAPSARIIAYEPTPLLAALMQRNLVRNGWTPRVEVRAAGISAAPGEREFYIHSMDGESTFEADRARHAEDVEARITVPVVALDDVFDAEGIAPSRSVIKVDVEGHESGVIDGLERTLRRRGDRPTLLMELLGRAISQDRIIDRILDYGLDVYYVSSNAIVRLRKTADLEAVQEVGQWNFLLTDRAPADVARLSVS